MNTTLSFNINIGDLNEIKKNRLQQIFNSDLPNGISGPNQLVLTGKDEQLIITPVQIQYSCSHEYFDKVQANIVKIQELLMLDQVINSMTVLIADLKGIERNSMTYTKEKFGSLIPESLGVGKREFFLYNQVLSEIRIEPFINDNEKIYIQAIYNISTKMISDINKVLNDVKTDYNSKREDIFRNLE